ncbi:MAG: DUF2415 domain-containing protein [Acidobacteria bacterium]|nr:DUF2415 domain-containing protein [Acidobacteriota bacterium]
MYFPGGTKNNHILKLDTASHSVEPVRLLSFSPRCLVAKNGWVCCGGETGEFTAVRLEPRHDSDDLDMQLDPDLDPDARLPLDLDSPRDAASMLNAVSRAIGGSGPKVAVAKSMKLVGDRVNCITLWFPPVCNPWPGAHLEPIAVLANNDKTVALVNLDDFDDHDKIDPFHSISYPDFVNRAVMSPDGRFLAAVLDDPYLYIHERVKTLSPSEGGSLFGPQHEWEYRDRYLLKSQKRDDKTQSRGSFAVCFSNSGAFLAVGTQHGTISIFDTTAFTDPERDPLLVSFKSSRPEALPGAVRDMAFCPGPYDLLAWTKDKGRVGIADVRTGFVYRQVIDLSDRVGIEEVTVSDENAIDPRLLNPRLDRDDSSPGIPSTFMTPPDRRRGGAGRPPRHELPLTATETRILEALQDGRRRREQRAAMRAAGPEPAARHTEEPMSVYTELLQRGALDGNNNNRNNNRGASAWAERAVRRALQSNDSEMPADATARLTRALDHLLGEGLDPATRDQERNATTQRATTDTSDDPPVPRTQRATMDTQDDPPPPRGGLSRGTRGEAIVTRYDDLDALYSLAYGNPAEARDEGEIGRRERTPFVAFLSGRDWDEFAARRGNPVEHGVQQAPPQSDNTAGLSWSDDGRIL